MNNIFRFLAREPALIAGVISAAIALAAGFGLQWSANQVTLVMAAVSALSSLVVRSQVSPTAALEVPMPPAATVTTVPTVPKV